MTNTLSAISSMATRGLLAELAAACRQSGGPDIAIQSVGGVDAARRVQAGEAFDVVVLAAETIQRLIDGGHLQVGSRVDLVRSDVAVAVRSGAPAPSVDSEAALRAAVLAAASIGYSTGPSGKHLLSLFERWGIADAVRAKTVQAPPGVPVGELVARGDAALGFQQLSELKFQPGIQVLGPLPPGTAHTTIFAAAIGTQCARVNDARAWLAFAAGPEATDCKLRHGMAAAA